jgi:hypothetical protein
MALARDQNFDREIVEFRHTVAQLLRTCRVCILALEHITIDLCTPPRVNAVLECCRWQQWSTVQCRWMKQPLRSMVRQVAKQQ